MAKQKGLLRVHGTIGGLNFYDRLGKPTVREAGGGFNRERIMQDPGMERVRENMSEFGHSSQVKKALRLGMGPLLQSHKDTTLHGRMMQLLQKIKELDTVSAHGSRRVALGMQTEEGKRLFKAFAFSPKRSALDLLDTTGHFDADALTYSLDSFSMSSVRFPANATHVELLTAQLRFDFETLEYQLALGSPLFISKQETVSSLELAIPGVADGTGMEVVFLCVRFYQEVSGKMEVYGVEYWGLEVLGVG